MKVSGKVRRCGKGKEKRKKKGKGKCDVDGVVRRMRVSSVGTLFCWCVMAFRTIKEAMGIPAHVEIQRVKSH